MKDTHISQIHWLRKFKILWKDITKKRYCYLELNFPGLQSSTQEHPKHIYLSAIT